VSDGKGKILVGTIRLFTLMVTLKDNKFDKLVHLVGFIIRIRKTNLMKTATIEAKLRIDTREFALFEWCRYWPQNVENTHKITTENPEEERHETK